MYHDMDDRLTALEERIGVKFKNRSLLLEAVTHRSYLNEARGFTGQHNERLEFLGDAVLEIIVTEHLFRTFTDEPEGKLTNWRAALVNAVRLSKVGETWQIGDAILMSRGERRVFMPGAKQVMYILANAVEAILGALYLDQGVGECRLVVDSVLLFQTSKIVAEFADYKTDLQELAQARLGITPHYRQISSSGPDHLKEFVIGVYFGEQEVARAKGNSKQEAMVDAAQVAFETLRTKEECSSKRNGRFSERGSRNGRNR